MIEFKIISCPDKSQQATYQHLGAELTIGKAEGDMVVDDPAMGALQLRVKIEGEKNATLENLNPTVEVRLNGKPVTAVVPIKEKDNLTVSRTTINFSRLDTTPLLPPEPFQHPNARERFSPGSKEQAILDALKYLEDHSGNPPLPPGAGAKPPPIPGGGAVKPPLPPGMSAPPPLPGKKN
jgi:hypothetical protein